MTNPGRDDNADPTDPISAGETGLTSILILCCDALDFTRRCLDSVLRHTRPPYELVLVDNGSGDDTPAYLDSLRARPGPRRVAVLRNETNCGFAAGCNQALAQARGASVLFLNNDTVVTPGWLEGLLHCAGDTPAAGLVGAMSNAVPAPQQVLPEYRDLDGLDAFADRHRRTWAGQALDVTRLSGFCLLVRRAVLDCVGGFDERFGLGFFEDDDLCVRAREAGFRLCVAQDVYVHHFGSRTFAGLGVDCHRQLRANFEQFRAKWGAERTAGYHLPADDSTAVGASGPARLAGPTQRLHVSLTMIVKNEEQHLPACLESAAGLFAETIIVDTGSTDRTKEIALRFGARVFDFPWVDSFAAARNEALRHATGAWAFWLDADDRLDDANRQALGDLFARLPAENVAYTVKCICLPDPQHTGATVVDHVRLFRNHPELRWRYRVHEQILPALREQGGAVCFTEIAVQHVGYQDATVRGRKLERDLRLLRLDHAEHPTDPFILFNLGAIHHELGRSAEALPFLMDSLRRSQTTDSIVRKLYALVAQCHRQLHEPGAALVACKAGRTHYPDDAELLFQEGLLLRQLGERDAARACFQRLLHSREGAHFASVDASLRGWKTRHNLAALCQEEGRGAEAEVLWRQTLAEQPDFGPAWVGLGDLLLEQGRWRELDEVLARLESAPHNALEAVLLRARGYLARKEYPHARQLLDAAIAREPRNIWPRVLLSHALLQEGRDWNAAEKALRDVLALDPDNAGVRRNLGVLLNQNGRRREALPA